MGRPVALHLRVWLGRRVQRCAVHPARWTPQLQSRSPYQRWSSKNEASFKCELACISSCDVSVARTSVPLQAIPLGRLASLRPRHPTRHLGTVETMSLLGIPSKQVQIERLKSELAKEQQSLEQSTAIRENDAEKFRDNEKELLESISSLKHALVVLDSRYNKTDSRNYTAERDQRVQCACQLAHDHGSRTIGSSHACHTEKIIVASCWP